MKKTLVALAALAVVGAASAQSSVTLYGRIDASIFSQQSKTGGVTTSDPGPQIKAGGHTGNRWGLKGSEDLGGGLKANFQLEQGFNVDAGTASSTRQFHRQAWLGLSSGWGAVTVGRQYDITDNAYGNYDPMGYSGYSAMGYAFNVGCGTGGSGDCVGRQDNAVIYSTPSMGGLSGSVMWAPGEDKAPGVSAGSMWGIMGAYSNGPLSVGFGWQDNQGPSPSATSKSRQDFNLGASYDLGMVKLYGQYEQGKDKNFSGSQDDGYQLGLTMPLGAFTLQASYAAEKQEVGNNKVSDSQGLGLLGRYDLSKRTYVYAAYLGGKTDFVGAANTKDTKMGLGLVHNF